MILCPNSDPDRSFLEMNQAELAKKYGIERFEYPHATSTIKHIGFAPKEQKWYGWSHRAIYGFKVGDTVKKGDTIAPSEPDDPYPHSRPELETLPVGFTAKTLDDARRMAAAFALSVS